MPKRKKDSDDNDKAKSTKTHDEDSGGGGTNNNAIPIFLKKTYRMIETCDPEICSWTTDGEMFVVKNPELFASEIIPQYFDHNKFSSFARQLNFYGFRKIQTKPIRNEDFDKSTAKHVTFFNEKFKRGRYDLLKEIQRSTRGGGAQASLADQAKEMETLRSTVATLEQRVQDLETHWQEILNREIQAKVELAMMDLLSSRQHPSTLQAQYMGMPQLPTSFGDASILQRAERSFGSIGRNTSIGRAPHGTWENPLLGTQAARAFSTASAASSSGGAGAMQGAGGGPGSGDAASNASGNAGGAGATLPPHPKQKSLPPPSMLSNQAAAANGVMRNVSGGRSLSTATNSSLLRSAWEDKFFSTLMMTDGASRAASLAGLANGMGATGGMAGGGAANVSGLAALAAAQQMQNNNAAGYAAYMQDRVRQSSMSMGRGGGAAGAGAPAGAGGVKDAASNLKRQTTAEILLEAAGELNAKGDKGGSGGKDEQVKI